MTVCGDKYLLLKNDNKYNVFNTKNNKNVFEFDISAFKNRYSKKGLEIIELEDAFYNFEGKN